MKKAVPMRRCIGCMQMKPKHELMRVVRQADGTVCFDKSGKANGRGAYLCQDIACIDKAKKNHGMARAFQCAVSDDVIDAIKQEIFDA